MNRTVFGWRVIVSFVEDWARSDGWRSFRFEISKPICDPPQGAWGVHGIHYRGVRFMMSVWVPFRITQWR
jgi:hypothetical protein